MVGERVAVGVRFLLIWEGDGVTVVDGVCDGVCDCVVVGDPDGDSDGDFVLDGVGDGEVVGDAVGVAVGVIAGLQLTGAARALPASGRASTAYTRTPPTVMTGALCGHKFSPRSSKRPPPVPSSALSASVALSAAAVSLKTPGMEMARTLTRRGAA